MIAAADLAVRLDPLRAIGAGVSGTTRLAWTPELAEAEEWFAHQARSVGLAVERDPAGSLWAVPSTEPPWWAAGSHLDTVRAGGAYDGALGVAAAFEVARASEVPLAVIAFADEEGARFNTPTFGSRALVGRLDPSAVLDRRDDAGTPLADALAGAEVSVSGLGSAPAWLGRLRGFVELHIDQTRDVAQAGVPAGVVRALAARMRLRADLEGRADHAGTTRGPDRRDPLAAAARLIVRAGDDGAVPATASRIVVEPNAPTTVPARVNVWLDARAESHDEIARWREGLEVSAAELAAATGVEVDLTVEADSAGVEFDPAVRAALAAALDPPGPEVTCFAGHDAGILAERIPAGMVLVRNEGGISHAPEEEVSLEDAAVAAEAMARALEALA